MKKFLSNAGAGLLSCLALEGIRSLSRIQFSLSEHGPALIIWIPFFMLFILLLIPVVDNLERIVFYIVKKCERVKIAAQGKDPDSDTDKKVKVDGNSADQTD